MLGGEREDRWTSIFVIWIATPDPEYLLLEKYIDQRYVPTQKANPVGAVRSRLAEWLSSKLIYLMWVEKWEFNGILVLKSLETSGMWWCGTVVSVVASLFLTMNHQDRASDAKKAKPVRVVMKAPCRESWIVTYVMEIFLLALLLLVGGKPCYRA